MATDRADRQAGACRDFGEQSVGSGYDFTINNNIINSSQGPLTSTKSNLTIFFSATDISIWLHQMVKGYQDAKGAPLANAHLMGLFQRLCKLLYFRIKPVFVFDGAFPELKKETIVSCKQMKATKS